MKKSSSLSVKDLHGIAQLAVHSTAAVTDLAEDLHQRIIAPRSATKGRTSGITGMVYRSVRGVTRLVGVGVTGVIRLLGAQEIIELGPAIGKARENLISILNGVVGDHLHLSGNPLSIQMHLRNGDLTHAPAESEKYALFIHGLCLNENHWRTDAHVQTLIDLGYTPLFLHYNTGRNVADNGADLSALLEARFGGKQVSLQRNGKQLSPQRNGKQSELIVVAHSMGGLVIRSALHVAQSSHLWHTQVSKIIFLGTPHLGAPLERSGNWIHALWQATPYAGALAPIAKIRSAGITDLRHGQILAGDANSAAHVALPLKIKCYAIAATLAKTPGEFSDEVIGDGLVPISSALGLHADLARNLALQKSKTKIIRGVGHMELLHAPQVSAQIRKWLA